MSVGIDLLWALVYIAALCLFVYVAIWILNILTDVQLPGKVVQIIWVIVVLIALIIIISTLLGSGPRLGLRGSMLLSPAMAESNKERGMLNFGEAFVSRPTVKLCEVTENGKTRLRTCKENLGDGDATRKGR